MTLDETKKFHNDDDLLSRAELEAMFGRIQRYGNPEARRMQQRFLLESLAIIVITVGAGWVAEKVLTSLICTFILFLFAAFFLALEILGLYYYFNDPLGENASEMLKNTHRQFQTIAAGMKTLHITIVFSMMAIIYVDGNYTMALRWQPILMLTCLLMMTWFFSTKWSTREKNLSKLVAQHDEDFGGDDEENIKKLTQE